MFNIYFVTKKRMFNTSLKWILQNNFPSHTFSQSLIMWFPPTPERLWFSPQMTGFSTESQVYSLQHEPVFTITVIVTYSTSPEWDCFVSESCSTPTKVSWEFNNNNNKSCPVQLPTQSNQHLGNRKPFLDKC